ncbi:actin cytoskeleton and mitosis protein [Coemansia sp. 'formosensis']|nr:actin cytoskeleton and mitosis protein [Coemansia sp. 'formosensis']
MDFNRAPAEEERLKALRRERFSNTEGEKRFKQMIEERARRRQQLMSQGALSNQSSLVEARKIVGTCTLMCPVFEREERELKNSLALQEVHPGTRQADPARTVKTFHRSAAGNEEPLPEDLRTADTLISTLDYLINAVVAQDQTLQSCHGFVRDRTRSIRQDFTIQNIRDQRTVAACERIARFHIVSLHVLCGHKGFAEQQDMEQLRNTLKTLIELYDDHRNAGIACANEAEFYAYYVVSHLRDSDAKRVAECLPARIFLAPVVQQALKLHRLSESSAALSARQDAGNLFAAQNLATQFFRAVASSQTPLLLACLAEYQFPSIRRAALKAMNVAFPYQAGREYPIDQFASMLAFDSVDEVKEFCGLFGVAVNERGIKLGERDGKRLVFKEPEQRPQRVARNLRVVGAKFLSTPMQAINSSIAQQFLIPAAPMITGSSTGLAPSAVWPAQPAMVPSSRVSSGQASSGGFGMASAAPFGRVGASAPAPVSAFGGSQPAATVAASSAFSFPKSSSFPVAQPAESFAGNRVDMFRVPPAASSTASAFNIRQGESGPDKAAASVPSFGISGSSKLGFTTAGAAQRSTSGLAAPSAPSLFSTPAPNTGSSQPSSASVVAALPATSIIIIPPTPGPESLLLSTAPKPILQTPAIPAPDVVWNKPRPRINWTSLSNALYDDLLASVVLDVAKPLAVRAKKCAQVANTLIEDIADAIVNYTSAFMAYEESYRSVLLAQAEGFRRRALMRRAFRRWSMEAVVRQQSRALEQHYIDGLDELIDSEYAERPRPRAYSVLDTADTMCQPRPQMVRRAVPAVPADFWESCHLGRDAFDAMGRALKKYGGPAFDATVDVSGTRHSVLGSWLWWRLDSASVSSHSSCEPPSRLATYTHGAQRLRFRELGTTQEESGELWSQIVLLAPEPIGPDDVAGDLGSSPLGMELTARVREALSRARAAEGAAHPILFLFWSSDASATRVVRRLVERTASASGVPSFVATHAVALMVATSKQQLGEGLRWVFKHVVAARRHSLIRASRAYETLGVALLQALRRIASVAGLLGAHTGGGAPEIFNSAVDVVNAYVGALNRLLSPVGLPPLGAFPHALPGEGVTVDYFCAGRAINGSSWPTLIADAIVGGSIDDILSADTMGGSGLPTLGACLRALSFAAKHRLDALHQAVPDAYVDRDTAAEGARHAALAADQLVRRVAELCQGPRAAELLASPGAKRPSSTAFSISPPLVPLPDVALSVASTPRSMPSISGLTVHSATKRHRPATELKLSRLQHAIARASEHLG